MKINEIITKYSQNLEQSNILVDIQKIYNNNKRNYPILLFPIKIEESILKYSELPNFGCNEKSLVIPKCPVKPLEPIKRTAYISPYESYIEREGVGFFVNFLIVFVGTGLIGGGLYMYVTNKYDLPIEINLLLFVCCLVLLPYYLNRQFPREDKIIQCSNEQRDTLRENLQMKYDSEYEIEIAKYKSDIDEYLKKEKEYQNAVRLYNKNLPFIKTKFNNFVNDLVVRVVKSSLSTQFQRINHPIVREGTSENSLFFALESKFPKYIKVDTMIMGYYPDLTLWVDGIGIDIEIDEPYTIVNGSMKEIHYLIDYEGISIDKSRNDTFIKNNWYVLRFAESQIKNNLHECLQIIQSLINFITSNNDNLCHLKEFIYLSSKISTNTWTKENARIMARTNYRNK
jgi:hypothetical protein